MVVFTWCYDLEPVCQPQTSFLGQLYKEKLLHPGGPPLDIILTIEISNARDEPQGYRSGHLIWILTCYSRIVIYLCMALKHTV